MAVPDFINQLESTYIDIRRCSGLDRAETIAFFYRWMMITNAIVLININVFFLEVKKKNYECATYSSVNSELLLKIPGGSCLIWFPFKYLRNGHIAEYLISPLWIIIIPR